MADPFSVGGITGPRASTPSDVLTQAADESKKGGPAPFKTLERLPSKTALKDGARIYTPLLNLKKTDDKSKGLDNDDVTETADGSSEGTDGVTTKDSAKVPPKTTEEVNKLVRENKKKINDEVIKMGQEAIDRQSDATAKIEYIPK